MFLFILEYDITIYNEIEAISPSFIRQEIKDDSLYNWHYFNLTSYLFKENFVNDSIINTMIGTKIGDIDSVSYISDGRILNVTFWLTYPFQEHPTKNVPNFIITINSDSNLLTGVDKGFDYRVRIKWDNTSKTWQKIFEETSPLGKTKYLDLDNNFTGFFNKNDTEPEILTINSYYPNHPCCYVTIPIDLGLINYPKQYVIHFAIINSLYEYGNKNRLAFILDSTDQVPVPPSDFFILPEQNSIEMRAGEEKKIRLDLNSTSFLPTHASLYVNSIKGIDLKISPNRIYLQPNNIATSTLIIKSLTDVETGPYTFTISANVSLPQVNETNQYSFESVVPSLYAQSNIAVTMNNALSFSEKFSSFWNVYGDAISLIGGGFIGGFSGFMFARLEKRTKKNK